MENMPLNSSQSRLAYGGKDMDMWILEETWRLQVESVGLLSLVGEEWFPEVPEKDSRARKFRGRAYQSKAIRVKDALSRRVQKLAQMGLLTQWPRDGVHGERALTLTSKADELLAEEGFPNMNYGKRFRGKYVNQKHHFGMSKCSIAYRMAYEIQEREGEILPGIEIAAGEEVIRTDSLWKLDDIGLLVEYERSKKPNPVLERKMLVYRDVKLTELLKKLRVSTVRVLWIAERGGQLPMLRQVAESLYQGREGIRYPFLFTHQGRFIGEETDVQSLLIDPIWQLSNGFELCLEDKL
jgi:hypothetical protein